MQIILLLPHFMKRHQIKTLGHRRNFLFLKNPLNSSNFILTENFPRKKLHAINYKWSQHKSRTSNTFCSSTPLGQWLVAFGGLKRTTTQSRRPLLAAFVGRSAVIVFAVAQSPQVVLRWCRCSKESNCRTEFQKLCRIFIFLIDSHQEVPWPRK